MADSVDRVFVHALNTVKKIPRMGSARPPPSDRLRLYGLYKQSMEGDVDGVMDRPRGDDDEIRSDQEKWDAWYAQKGLSRTEAKRQYIATLIGTMHRYASNTPDARELVSELEFVWDQIKSNPPSSSSSHSYPMLQPSNTSPSSSNNRVIYPVMSDRGARHPSRGTEQAMRVVSPVSESRADEMIPETEDERDEDGREEFVDAQDSQMAENERQAPDDLESVTESRSQSRSRDRSAPLSKYLAGSSTSAKKSGSRDDKWQRRIESALIKMNAEMAALREQLEMNQEAVASSSILPFGSTRNRGWFAWTASLLTSVSSTLFRHVLINMALLAVVSLYMHYRGIPLEHMENAALSWIRKVQSWALVRRIGKMTESRNAMQISRSLGFRSTRSGKPGLERPT